LYEGNKGCGILVEDVKGKTVTIGIGSWVTTFDEFLVGALKAHSPSA